MKKKIVWLGLSFLLVVALVLASCGGTAPGEQEEEEEEEEEEAELVTLSMGETYLTSKIKVTISEPTLIDSYEYHDENTGEAKIKEAKPGEDFLVVYGEVENVGDELRRDEGRDRFRVYDAEGKYYRSTAYFDEPEALLVARSFSPDETIVGKLIFYIPEGKSGLKIAYVTALIPVTAVAEWVVE